MKNKKCFYFENLQRFENLQTTKVIGSCKGQK